MATIRKRGNSYHIQIRKNGYPQITNPSKTVRLPLHELRKSKVK